MEDAARRAARSELSVPLVVETGWARSWDQAH
jgi:DNA polymerase I-like protein with 3'-5' exonuclease and polymerase domains